MNISAQVLSGADGFMLNSLTYMASPPPNAWWDLKHCNSEKEKN